MDDWAMSERVRTLVAAFTTVVVVAVMLEQGAQGTSSMSDLLTVVSEMANAIKNPTHWIDTLYERVMEIDGYDERVLVEVFDYLISCESEARGFMVREIELRKDWINRFLSRMD